MDALSALRHRVTIQDPRTHLVDVTLHLPAAGADGEHRITMPAWTPGSYLIREFARQVEGLRAEGEGGHELPVSKIAKGTWAVRAGAGRAATVRYRVYAHELTVRTSCITADFALLNGGGVFFQLEGAAGAPQEVEVVAPPGWKVHCALPRAPGGALRARDFEELVDSPIECGPFDAEPLELPGAGAVQAEVVWVGWEWCDAPPPRAEVRADLARLFAPTAAVFGQGYPFQRYLFIVHLVEGYGGLEHRASSVLLYSRSGLRPKDKYEKFMALASHELFHAWNGKRLRPRVLGPFDYEREAYTRALWLVEGVTSYYDELLLRRAGLIGVESYLKYLAGQVRKLDETPGRAMQSLEEASFDAWVKLYRPDEHTPNSTVSYYLKGEIVGLLLDLEIRARSGGARSLDDVMRRLWVQYGREGARGYEDDAPFATIAEVAGREVLELAERWIRGRDDLDYGVTLGRAGLALERTSEDGLAAGPGGA
jgi:predicted metalloprotease with PDZ domain